MGDTKKKSKYALHVAIGFAIVAVFWVIPPIEPITEVGMKCVGIFIGMVYMWSTIGALWPSVAGLVLFGISGYAGDGVSGFNQVMMEALGSNTVVMVLFCMILFGALDEVGDTKYIAKFFLTRKIFQNRPYVFLAVFYLTCFVLGALISPISSLILLWPVALSILEELDIRRTDKVWKFFFVGMFLVSTLGQPLFPFMRAPLIPVSAFAKMTANMGTPMEIPTLQYMVLCIIMTTLVVAVFLILIKLRRVDMSKLKAVEPAIIEKKMPLPKMNLQQKLYIWMVPAYLLMIMVPPFFKGMGIPVFDLLNTMGPTGIAVFWVVLFVAIRWQGKPLLPFKEVAYKQMNWGILFMVAAAVYGAGTLSSSSTGVTDFLVQALNPLLGGQSEMVFVIIMFTVALVITNFANNAAMAVVLMPVVLTFSNQLGINPIPVAMGVILMVFVAMLTPAASPQAGMMFGRKDIYSGKDIMSVGLPMCIVTLVLYISIGYPLAKLLVGA